MAHTSNFRTIYQQRCQLSSSQLSLLTPFISIRPKANPKGQSSNKYIRQSVKLLLIIQDSDVIVFNKIIATVLFVPDSNQNKYNFMDDVNVIFNQGSEWYISCGWTGPDFLSGTFQTYITNATLLKTNIKLVGSKYIGTLLFCGCSFLNFRDTVVPMDRMINLFLKDAKDSRYLTQLDFFLNATLLNRALNGQRLGGQIDTVKKSYESATANIQQINTSVSAKQGWIHLSDTLAKQFTDLTPLESKKLTLYTNKLKDQVFGVKWRTVRYLLSAFSYFVFDDTYKIFINRQSSTTWMDDMKSKANAGQDGKYFAPQRVEKITASDPTMILSHILNMISQPLKSPVITYMIDYEVNNNSKASYVNNGGTKSGYEFNDRGDVLIDLYAFNKKIYLTNLLLRFARINEFRMTGFPPIMIKFDDPMYANMKAEKKYYRVFTLVISILWSYPLTQKDDDFPNLNIYYDDANQLFNNFQILTPLNQQMLKINLSRVLTDVTGLNDTDKLQRLLLSGIISSVKRVVVPNKLPNTRHVDLKHRMYTRIVKKINGGSETPSDSAKKIMLSHGGKFAGIINNGDFTIYYFSSSLSITKLTLFTKYMGKKLNAQKGDTAIITYIQKQITGEALGDISGKLISYLRNRLYISFDVHGLFDIPVFRSYVTTHGFPGPIPLGQQARWINGTYIITHQSTKVDRANIKTTIKRHRLPRFTAAKSDLPVKQIGAEWETKNISYNLLNSKKDSAADRTKVLFNE